MIVVTDTSPVRALAQLQLLHVLPILFGEVFVPPEVVRELAVDVPGVGVVEVAAHAFFKVRTPSDPERLMRQHSQLGRGEAEALELALELRADYILVDDGAARAVARRVGLTALGVLGVSFEQRTSGLSCRLVRSCIVWSLKSASDSPNRCGRMC